MGDPEPRPEVFDLYWYFAAERHAIFERRVAGLPPPWTSDRILATFKFCNAYRAADRVSQFLIRDIAYSGREHVVADRLFQIVAFRMFSRVETWRGLCRILGGDPTLNDLRSGAFERALERVRLEQGRLYTGAFILCATNAYGRALKYQNHAELLRHMFLRGSFTDRLVAAPSLKAVYELLHEYPLIGDFMAYQIAIDLNYSETVAFDENDFTKAGPGALRGIRKTFVDTGGLPAEDLIAWMVERQAKEFEARSVAFRGLWGRPLHAVDCQGLFCEVDKYCREALPGLKSARTRIKSRYSVARERVKLFFPPKWNINHLIPKDFVLGAQDELT